ncbi:amidohydrolase [Halanaerobium sp. ST460_2HS_T2]|uniref:amidohydrolase n=1 Tax=Halanaerobium sp. ST460_2HS_T2 TaxID=2183914 RepID=UPI000DF473DE|nr:amidohydrolase [Halanaerobium sp. ST460_2HS_T2]RCW52369.1 5-methylthioadenosine/S-adenosylhomocysteine deaminase [Halanaerobium sp. ST460_2HS_T2]
MNNVYTLTNAVILTMDEKNPLIESGKIVIKNDRISKIGKSSEIEAEGKIYSLKNKLLMPGLINTHSHSVSPLFRGMADDLKLMDWLNNVIWPAEKHLNAETAYWGAAMCSLEYIANGITTFVDQYYFAVDIARAVADTGIRAVLAPSVFSGNTAETKDTFQTAKDFIEKYQDSSEETNIYPAIGPHAPYSCDEKLLQDIGKYAREKDILVHIHISETVDENRQIYDKYGVSPTQFLKQTGILDNKVLAAHCIHLNDYDLQIFKEKDISVSYNPISNLKLVSGIMPMPKMVEKELLITIGTDGAQSNNSLDLLRDLKTGILLQKQFNEDATFIKAKEAVEFVTKNGAKAIGLEDQIGSLEIGKKADLISIDLNSVNLNPVHFNHLENIYSAIAYSASGHEVKDVIINGKFIMKDGNFLKISKENILDNSKKQAEILMKKAGLL